MHKKKLGIIGLGYVGSAVLEGLKNYHNIETFDTVKESSCDSINDLINSSDMIFVAVPTPMNKKGECDLSIVNDVMSSINDVSQNDKIVILKSTSIPQTTNELKCEAIPEVSLTKGYIDTWNSWNGNELPYQVVDGVNDLVKQCYQKAKTNQQKQYLKQTYRKLILGKNEFLKPII